MVDWEADDEGGTATFPAICHNITAVAISNFSAYCKADSRALVFEATVQPLEECENLFAILRIEADAVVRDGDFADFLGGQASREFVFLRRDDPS